MRVKKEILHIDNSKVKNFFNEYSKQYSEDNQYGIIMNQATNKEIAQARDESEKKIVLPLLNLSEDTSVYDIGCGMGRWADALPNNIRKYCGIDFSEELVGIARERETRSQYQFEVETVVQAKASMKKYNWDCFDIVLIAGVCQYLNEEEIISLFENLDEICKKSARVYLRVPIGMEDALTLKEEYSSKLNTNYNAIYRTRVQYEKLINLISAENPFHITSQGFMYDEENTKDNNAETKQYYYLLER